MRNTYTKRSNNTGFNSFGAKKEFRNVPQEKKFNPYKNFYTTFTNSEGSYLVTYYGKFRSEAVAYFEELARLDKAKLDKYIGTF